MTQLHKRIRNIHAQVLDSCIAVISVGRWYARTTWFKRHLFTSMSSPALSPTWVSQCCLWQRNHQREQGVMDHSLVSHAPYLWHRATTTTYVPTERRRRPHVEAFADNEVPLDPCLSFESEYVPFMMMEWDYYLRSYIDTDNDVSLHVLTLDPVIFV